MNIEICVGPALRNMIPAGWGLATGTGSSRDIDGTLVSATVWLEIRPHYDTVAKLEDAPPEAPTITVSDKSD